MSLATEMQDDIAELLDDVDIGRAIIIQRFGAGTYSATDGTVIAGTIPANITTRGLFLDYHDRVIDGTLIKRGDRKLFIKLKSITYTPAIGEVVVAGSSRYSVIDFDTIELGGTAIIYILQVRGV